MVSLLDVYKIGLVVTHQLSLTGKSSKPARWGRTKTRPLFLDGLNRSAQYTAEPNRPYLDGHPVEAFGGDDPMVPVIVDFIVVDRQDVTVVVGVETVPRVVVHLVPPPISLLVAVCVDPEVIVVNVRIVDVAVHIVQQFVITLVDAEPTNLVATCDQAEYGLTAS